MRRELEEAGAKWKSALAPNTHARCRVVQLWGVIGWGRALRGPVSGRERCSVTRSVHAAGGQGRRDWLRAAGGLDRGFGAGELWSSAPGTVTQRKTCRKMERLGGLVNEDFRCRRAGGWQRGGGKNRCYSFFISWFGVTPWAPKRRRALTRTLRARHTNARCGWFPLLLVGDPFSGRVPPHRRRQMCGSCHIAPAGAEVTHGFISG